MKLADTHCHLGFDDFDKDREQVLARAWEAGMERILLPGVDLASSRKAVRLAESHPKLFAAVGVHPNSALTWEQHTKAELKSLAAHPKVVALGEIGLDYYRHHAPHDAQRQVLNQQLELALEMELPVILH
ncbi:MAG: TatD family hydrolase, partial [Chloroflexota bacterium]|nr:TatD family hydrolase [Chloroflexota bacterium]